MLVCLVAMLAAGCKDKKEAPASKPDDAAVAVQPAAPADAASRIEEMELPPPPPVPGLPLGLPSRPEHVPADNPARVALGRLLFFDKRLSWNASMSCASCHDPDKGWTDGRIRADNVAQKPNLRHTPTLWNLAYATEFFWDGRVRGLDAMIEAHWKGQMLANHGARTVAARLAALPAYRAHVGRAFRSSGMNADTISAALGAFVRTMFNGDSAWDRYEAGDRSAVSEDAIAGFIIFTRKAQCALCHPPPLYTDGGYHNVGVGAIGPDNMLIDVGRALVTREPDDEGAFKTPTLRGVSLTAPYYHDGSADTLEQTLIHGLRAAAERAAPGTVPGRLSPDEIAQLMAFLQALTPEMVPYARPTLPSAQAQ